MEENVLKDYETFSEFPDKYLKINSTSNYFLIKKDSESFVTKRNIDSISIVKILSNQKLLTLKSFFDVKTGSLVLNTKSISNADRSCEEYLEFDNNIKIISLSEILNIKGNDIYNLSKEDIDILTDFKEENAKSYNLKPRKNLF